MSLFQGRRRSIHAPEHFAFVHASAELTEPPVLWLWKYRYLTIVVALFFAFKGGHAVLLLPRNQWTFPIVNNRALLITHWCFGTPFLAGVLWQQLSLPLMANAGRKWGPIAAAKFRRWHRWVGKFTIVMSLGAAMTAFLLAPRALAGQWLFVLWSICWMIMTIETWGTAILKQYDNHKRWANALSRTALAFLYGRVLLVSYNYASSYWMSEQEHLEHAKKAYTCSMAGTGLFTIMLTAQCAYAARLEQQQSVAKRRWRKIKSATTFMRAAGVTTKANENAMDVATSRAA